MTSSSFLLMTSIIEPLGVWTLTYLAHSTLLFGGAWLLCRAFVLRSPALRERLWKLGAVGGVITATLALGAGWGLTIGNEPPVEKSTAVVKISIEPVEPQSSLSDVTHLTDVRPVAANSPEDAELLQEAERIAALLDESAASEHAAALEAKTSNERPLSGTASVVESTANAEQAVGWDSIPTRPQAATAHSSEVASTEEPQPATTESVQQDLITRIEEIEGRARVPILQWCLSALPRAVGWLAVVWMTLGLLRLLRGEWVLARVIHHSIRGSASDRKGKRLRLKSRSESASETESRQSLSPARSEAEPRNEWIAEQLLNELAARSKARVPRLLFSTTITEPMACGVLRPTILMPYDIEERLSRDELRALLAHEFAHLQRGDVLWLWIGRFLTACLGYQPLNRIARRAWQVAAEIQCDDWAVEHDISAMSLASCLAQVAEWKLDRLSVSALAAKGASGSLTLRIERLLADRVPDAWNTRWRTRLSLVLGFGLGLAFASIAPRLDESLWATEAVEDLEERMRLWDEIRSDLQSVEETLESVNQEGEALHLGVR